MALHTKAKEEPDSGSISCVTKVYRHDVLTHAYPNCKANKGLRGWTECALRIEANGAEHWLGELAKRLRTKARPEAVKRVWLPKSNGKLRPLGIPTITDRVVQTAAMLLLAPISPLLSNLYMHVSHFPSGRETLK